jgi:hypothetical protein
MRGLRTRSDRLSGCPTSYCSAIRRNAVRNGNNSTSCCAGLCRTAASRLESLSERVARANQLLSTRIDLSHQRQNRALLETMNSRAEAQLRLQLTVEGLSVAAVTYYIIGLVGYASKGLKSAGWALNPDVIVGDQHSDRSADGSARHTTYSPGTRAQTRWLVQRRIRNRKHGRYQFLQSAFRGRLSDFPGSGCGRRTNAPLRRHSRDDIEYPQQHRHGRLRAVRLSEWIPGATVLRSAMRLVAMKVPDTRARCDFESIPPRTYALVVPHDENMNGKLDTSRERVGNRHGSHVRSLPVCRLRLPQGRTGTSATWNTPMPERVLFRL